jgi:hypothetical protein
MYVNYSLKQELHQLTDDCSDDALPEDTRSMLQDDPSYWWNNLSQEEKIWSKNPMSNMREGTISLLVS